MSRRNYWTTLRQRKISRRTMLGASAKAGVGAAGLALVGCGDDDEPDAGAVAAERAAAAAEEAAAAAVAAGEARAADSEAAAATAAGAADAAADAADAAGEASAAASEASAAAGQAAATAQETAEAAAETAAAAVAAAQEAADAAQEAAESAAMAAEEDEPAPATGPKYGGTLAMLAVDGGIFDPAIAIHGGTDSSIFPIYDFLNWQDDGIQVTAGMAELPEVVDELNIIYNIKPNVHWQDKPPLNGRQFVAEDAAFGLARFGQDNPDFVWRDRYASVDQFEVPDELTLHIKAKEPFAPLLTAVSEVQALMVSRDAVEAFGDDGIASNIEAAIGTGSMQIVSREGDVETVLERNPNYFRDGLPYIDEWRMPWLLDVAQRIAQYVAGDFDFLSLPWAGSGAENDTLRSQLGEEDYTTLNMRATWGVQTWFHTKVEPYTDARVRKALHLATDREQIAAIFPGRYGIGGVLPAAIAPYGKTVDELRALPGFRSGDLREQDLAEARQLLDASGYDAESVPPMSTGGGGGPLSMEAMQQHFAAIGFDVDLEIVPDNENLARRSAGEFSLLTQGHGGAGDPDKLFNELHTTGGQNYGEFSDPEIDSLLEKGRRTFGVENREAIYDEIQDKMLEEHLPRIWWSWGVPEVLYRPWLKGYRRNNSSTAANQILNSCWFDGKPS